MTAGAWLLLLGVAVGVLAGCGPLDRGEGDGDVLTTSADIQRRGIAPRTLMDLTDADFDNGWELWRRCRQCHFIGGDIHGVGPNLAGVFGREVGTAPDFIYTSALRRADFVWAPELLNEWLTDPGGFLPGTRMAFRGVPDSADRRDLIAWLMRATARVEDGGADPSEEVEAGLRRY